MLFERDDLDEVRRFYSARLDADATPLHRLSGLARALGVNELLVKDESNRFGLPAFKILGTQYAVARLIKTGRVTDLACATAGNHGRAVARAARLANLRGHVYVPRGTARARVSAIRSEGADLVEVDADYDECVRIMAAEAGRHGWTIVSDTSWPGNEEIPGWIMAGYTWMLDEAARMWGPTPPDLLVVQAGVGSLAGAVAGWLEATFGHRRPRLVVVEPVGSACVAASLEAGSRVSLPACAPTVMAGLRCAEVSPLAWQALRETVDGAVQILDEAALAAVETLAHPHAGDPAVEAGAAGAAGLAGLVQLLTDRRLDDLRQALGISSNTRALIFNTEGITDR
jgi:diaminopropionate ammonia-lyase